MTTDRPYRAAMSQDEAIAELRRCQFDPAVVEALTAVSAEAGRRGAPGLDRAA